MTCKLSAIVAVCDDWGIGLDGGMIVENREDMRHFVACTTGHAVIMGRRTLESLPGGRPLKNRRNVVLTRDASFSAEGVCVAHSVDGALAAVADQDEAWVIGGGQVYELLLPRCERAIVTRNHCVRPSDAFFPTWTPTPPGASPRCARAASPPRAFPSTSLPTSATESPRRSVYGNNGLKSARFSQMLRLGAFLASNFTVLWESTSRVRSCAGFDMNLKVVGKIFDATSGKRREGYQACCPQPCEMRLDDVMDGSPSVITSSLLPKTKTNRRESATRARPRPCPANERGPPAEKLTGPKSCCATSASCCVPIGCLRRRCATWAAGPRKRCADGPNCIAR